VAVEPKSVEVSLICRFGGIVKLLYVGIVSCSILLLSNCLTRFPVVDEIAHLPAGLSHVKYSRFDLYRVNPPFVRTTCAWLGGATDIYDWSRFTDQVGYRPEFAIGEIALMERKLDLLKFFVYPRLVGLVFWLIGCLVLVRMLGRVVSPTSGILAGWLWISSPSILSSASTICPDLCAVVAGVATVYASWRYMHDPKLVFASYAGALVGVALLTKLTWLSAMISIPATALVCGCLLRKHLPSRSLFMRLNDLAVFWLLAVLVLNTGYLFEDTLKPLGEYEFCSEMLGGSGCNANVHGNRFSQSFAGNVPVPIPRNFLLGIDYLKHEVEERKWSFLMGEWKFGSWSLYYVMTVLFKTPEPTLVAALLGSIVFLVGVCRKTIEPRVISMFLFLGIPAGLCFVSVSVQGGFNHHHRYVLMIYPLIFALASYVTSPVAVKMLQFRPPMNWRSMRSVALPLAVTLTALSVACSLYVHPYYTSYFNTLSGGPENGWRLLGFSNIDWGQDILEVDKWLKVHTDRRPLVMDIDYFGMNGNLFDVPTSDPPQLPKGASVDEVRRSIAETQWWIISVKKLYNLPDQKGLEYLQQLQPVEKIAYAYHVYRIDPLPADPKAPDLELLQE
jgi:hypothetical protein